MLTPSALLHVLIVLAAPPLMLGIINRTKALFAGRSGPPLLQPYYDLARLFRKDMVVSRVTTWVFRAGPIVGLVAVIAASLLLPLGTWDSVLAFPGDLLLFVYLLALGRFFTAAAALDTGSSFEGMGAARDLLYAALAEPALFFGLIVLAKQAGSFSLSPMLAASLPTPAAAAPVLLVGAGFFIILLVEGSRVPFDDPNTHLELTMVHEVMVLDHSGPALGMILYGAAIKLFLLAALIARVALPATGNLGADVAVLLGGVALVAVVIGVVESTMARLRLVHVPQLLVGVMLLSAFGLVLYTR
jgi:formate hydrogenlyase subunit 4